MGGGLDEIKAISAPSWDWAWAWAELDKMDVKVVMILFTM